MTEPLAVEQSILSVGPGSFHTITSEPALRALVAETALLGVPGAGALAFAIAGKGFWYGSSARGALDASSANCGIGFRWRIGSNCIFTKISALLIFELCAPKLGKAGLSPPRGVTGLGFGDPCGDTLTTLGVVDAMLNFCTTS